MGLTMLLMESIGFKLVLLLRDLDFPFGLSWVLFNGRFFDTSQPPNSYIIINFFYKSPEFILLCYIIFIYFIIVNRKFFSNRFNFKPNVFINITKFINDKIKIMNLYSSEIKKHPFPRSLDVIKSLAILRGSESGYKAAEAFYLYIERSDNT